jgi:hypothetical protein
MMYNLSFLLLWRPLVLDIVQKAKANQTHMPDHVQFALACIKLADTCRIRSEEMLQSGRINAFSWAAVYTIFLSEAYVVALLHVEGLRMNLGDQWRPAVGGIRILVASACGSSCATQALNALKVRHQSVINALTDK